AIVFGLAERLRGGGGNQSKPKPPNPDSTVQQSNQQPSTAQQSDTGRVIDPTGENAARFREQIEAERAHGIKPQMMAPPRFGHATAGRLHGTNSDENKQEL
ncbi:9070_t:CDS:1, partial [Acaulospora colombiana]